MQAEQRSAGGQTGWPLVVAAKVTRKGGCDQAGLLDGLERRGEGEEGEIRGDAEALGLLFWRMRAAFPEWETRGRWCGKEHWNSVLVLIHLRCL